MRWIVLSRYRRCAPRVFKLTLGRAGPLLRRWGRLARCCHLVLARVCAHARRLASTLCACAWDAAVLGDSHERILFFFCLRAEPVGLPDMSCNTAVACQVLSVAIGRAPGLSRSALARCVPKDRGSGPGPEAGCPDRSLFRMAVWYPSQASTTSPQIILVNYLTQ